MHKQPAARPFPLPRNDFSLKQIALPTSPLMTANPLPVSQHIFTCIHVVSFFSQLHSFIVLLTGGFVLRGSLVLARADLRTGNVL